MGDWKITKIVKSHFYRSGVMEIRKRVKRVKSHFYRSEMRWKWENEAGSHSVSDWGERMHWEFLQSWAQSPAAAEYWTKFDQSMINLINQWSISAGEYWMKFDQCLIWSIWPIISRIILDEIWSNPAVKFDQFDQAGGEFDQSQLGGSWKNFDFERIFCFWTPS